MTILHHLKTPWLKKLHFTKYLEISKREIRMFTFIHLNFEWNHSNLRLRFYLHWIKIIDKYKMIAKTLWPLIQVNLPLMFDVNEITISPYSTKKALWFFFTVTLQPFIKYHSSSPCFPSRTITKNVETHPPLMRDVIIEQPLLRHSTFFKG